LRSAGALFGAGVLARLPETTCPLGEVRRVAAWLAGRSTRQCGPCTFGLPAVVQSLDTVLGGGGPTAVTALRARARSVVGRGACAHPDGASRFVLSAVGAFPEDVELHGTLTGCGRPVEGWLPLP
jgi:NADH:ubiquinone oxidoreductase subunit F (NADH-binding)